MMRNRDELYDIYEYITAKLLERLKKGHCGPITFNCDRGIIKTVHWNEYEKIKYEYGKVIIKK